MKYSGICSGNLKNLSICEKPQKSSYMIVTIIEMIRMNIDEERAGLFLVTGTGIIIF
jgi:hypothetical protein